MKQTIKSLAFAIAAAALLSSVSARGQNTGFYLKGDLGGNITPKINLNEFFGPVAPGSKVKLDPGVRGGITGGYQLCDYFAAEAEVGFFGNRIDSVTGATQVHDASFVNVPVLLNARLQYPNRSPLMPYIGAGLGFSQTILDVDQLTVNDITLHGSDSDTVFAYQAFAGLRYALNDHMGLSLEYHYFAAESAHWRADFSFGTPSDTVSFGPSRSHSLSIAFDYRF